MHVEHHLVLAQTRLKLSWVGATGPERKTVGFSFRYGNFQYNDAANEYISLHEYGWLIKIFLGKGRLPWGSFIFNFSNKLCNRSIHLSYLISSEMTILRGRAKLFFLFPRVGLLHLCFPPYIAWTFSCTVKER